MKPSDHLRDARERRERLRVLAWVKKNPHVLAKMKPELCALPCETCGSVEGCPCPKDATKRSPEYLAEHFPDHAGGAS